ncbi:hypothetical protein DFJ67_5266 [Asanoa ferruginea]|uniref:Uncharacterized protein n=1 Tax=Asanoa ferruginea TaxID=53367 RepID=A0A3D9ZPQ0_9ACTN|nr:hypothetical protein DFJ67_5266 [Asanoa ferruginea]
MESAAAWGCRPRVSACFVIRDGKAAWRPAVDVYQVIIGGRLVAIAALLVVRALIKARRR